MTQQQPVVVAAAAAAVATLASAVCPHPRLLEVVACSRTCAAIRPRELGLVFSRHHRRDRPIGQRQPGVVVVVPISAVR